MPCSIDRRGFLRESLAATAAAAFSSTFTAPVRASSPQTPSSAFDLGEVPIAELQRRMQSGQDTARSLVDKYLAQIDAVDGKLHSVIEISPDARSSADALDAERKARGPRGPLHGIPILVKDNIATADRMMTTAGSLALEGFKAPRDAFVVKRLRDAGAVILGKTNLSEWANFRSTHSSSGWSARGGQCRNPYALDRNPSGSSSGSGAATAASLCAASLGTETDGSIVSPANNCSVVGFKPTIGLVSRSGIVPISHTQDTAGPMTRTVADAAILLSVIAGPDPLDATTTAPGRPTVADYTAFLDPNGLKGARIGIPRKKLFGYSLAADRIAEQAIADLRKLGATVIDPADIATAADLDKPEFEVLLYEFKHDLNEYLAALPPGPGVRTLKEAIAFNTSHRDRELPYFGQEIFEMAEAKGPLTTAAYRTALASCRRLSRTLGIDATMNKYRLDALVAPTGAPAWLIDLVNGDSYSGSSSTVPAVAGYPHITVPAGYEFGLPVGLSFFGRAWSEPTLFKLAYAYEQATRHRHAPLLPATTPLTARV
jgi:amidase